MNPLVLAGVVAGMVALRFARSNVLVWMLAWWVAAYVVVRFGIEPPLPLSIRNMFMAITTVSLFTYVLSDQSRMEDAKRPIVRFIVEKRFTVPLVVIVVVLPVLVGYRVHLGMSREIAPPTFGRTVHPAPPTTISFRGKTIDLIAGHNPYRELEGTDEDQFDEHVQSGRRVYYQNCVFCHGDDMGGDGIFAHALDPIPANLEDPTTIAMLQETYLFWRIAKGGPGLPDESAPWASAMPAWEDFLTEEEIWDVILFLYDHTGQRPRAREEH